MKNKIQTIIDICFQVLKVIVGILSIIGFAMLMYWLGFKGLVGLLIGLISMSILLVMQNPLLMMILKATHSDWYAKELIKQGESKNGIKEKR